MIAVAPSSVTSANPGCSNQFTWLCSFEIARQIPTICNKITGERGKREANMRTENLFFFLLFSPWCDKIPDFKIQYLICGFYHEEVKTSQHLGTAWRTTKRWLDRFRGAATTDAHLIPCRRNSHRLGQFSRPWADSEDLGSLPRNRNVLLFSIVPWFSHHGNGMITLTLTCKSQQDLQAKALRVSHCYCWVKY